jgi:tRNA threonylcarbamoyladenosine biosynthesis protein TsaE
MKKLEYLLPDEAATIAIGDNLAKVLHWQNEQQQAQQSLVVFLNGDLGAGKTTLTRGFVRGMGHKGNVKSPTYTLVEPYELAPWQVYHFDLYRLSDPEELEYMGIRDYFADNCCCFIEWPEKGTGLLASADIIINMAYQNEQRVIDLQACSKRGEDVLQQLALIDC